MIDQEVEMGLQSLAVPLVNARGRVVAALNVGVAAGSGPADTLAERFLDRLLAVRDGLRGLMT